MVYIDPDELRWMPYVKTWLASMKKHIVHEETPDFILELFSRYVDQGLKFVNKKCTQMIMQVCCYPVMSDRTNFCVFLCERIWGIYDSLKKVSDCTYFWA